MESCLGPGQTARQRAGTLSITWSSPGLFLQRIKMSALQPNTSSKTQKVSSLGSVWDMEEDAPSADLRHNTVSLKSWENHFQSRCLTPFHHARERGTQDGELSENANEGWHYTIPPQTAQFRPHKACVFQEKSNRNREDQDIFCAELVTQCDVALKSKIMTTLYVP